MDDPILARRSVRTFTSSPVNDEQVEALLRAAMAAPSAGNQQPWHYVVIRDTETLRQIPAIHPFARMLNHAPTAVVVCGMTADLRWPEFWPQDCAAATENLLIKAQMLGLGAVWLGVHPLEDRVKGVRRLLDMPEAAVPFSIVAVGHAATPKASVDRFDPARVHHNRW